MEKSAADRIVEVFQEQGVDTIFGLPGGLVSPIYAALAKTDIRVVITKHESTAVLCAAGYAMATGKPGVVVVTAGPGVTNAVTGVATAMTERIPLVIFGGEVPRSAFGRGALQEGSSHTFDAVGMMANVTKSATQLVRADAVASTVREAFATAQSGVPGPVFLSLPVDVGMAVAKNARVRGRVVVDLRPDELGASEAASLLGAATRPLIVAGSGARGRAGKQALIRLAEATGVPVAVTPKGKGVFPENHRLYLGVLGFGGHESVIEYLKRKLDVVIVCGAGLNDFSTNAWTPLLHPAKALIHIDVDANKFGKNYAADLCLLGRLEDVVNLMVPQVSAASPKAPDLRLSYQAPQQSTPKRITTVDVMAGLNELAPKNAVYTVDMGEHLAFALHYLAIAEEGDFITCLGFGPMGSSIPMGIGLALGHKTKNRRVYVICGDGGMNMWGSELNTAAQLGVPITFVVLNDSRLSMCHFGMLDRYGITNDFSNSEVDFAAIANASGARGKVISTIDELRRALRSSNSNGVELFDIRIDPEVRLGGSQRTSALRQFCENPE